MKLYLKGLLYNVIIDPLLANVRTSVTGKAGTASNVIDIACGTGSLAFDLAGKVSNVTAIDLDQDLIAYAAHRAEKRGVKNIHFESRDASDLSMYSENRFDIAVTSMSVHQFEAQLAIRILTGMKRIASKVIIADYNNPLPVNLSGKVALGLERIAGGDHYRNFGNYMTSGGLKFFTDKAGLEIKATRIRGNGVFMIVVCW